MRQILHSIALMNVVACSVAFGVACSAPDAPSGGGYGGEGPPATAAIGQEDSGAYSASGASGASAAQGGSGASSSSPAADAGASGTSGWQEDAGSVTSTGTGAGAPAGGEDAGATSSSPPASSAPTWTEVYTRYLASGTIGNCTGCHSQTSTASGTYGFLSSYLDGTQSTLGAILSWMGGSMPPGGSASDAKATADVNAWVAAGALNN